MEYIKEFNELGKLSLMTRVLIKEFEQNYKKIKYVVDNYDARYRETTRLSNLVNAVLITVAFIAGTFYFPMIYRLIMNFV